MPYCHECGAEVTKTDIYCAICGIAMEFPPDEPSLKDEVISLQPEIDVLQDDENSEENVIASQPVIVEEELDDKSPTIETDIDKLVSTEIVKEIEEEPPMPSIIKQDDFQDSENEVAELPVNKIDEKSESFTSENVIETVQKIEDKEFSEPIENIEEEEFSEPEKISYIDESENKDEIFERIFNEEKVDESNVDDDEDIEELVETHIIENKREPIIDEFEEKEEIEEIEQIEEEKSITKSNPFESTIPYNLLDVEMLNLKESEVEEKELDLGEVFENKESIDEEEIIAEPAEITNEIEPEIEILEDKIVEEPAFAEEITPEIVVPIVAAVTDLKPNPNTSQISESVDTGGKSKQLKPLEEGTLLNNRYEVVRKIGGGGMGAVYLASDRNLGGVLRAVKEMVQSYIEEDQQEKAVNDFRRESLLLTSLEHPSIPTIYDYFFDDREGRFYLVMKYISGGDLAGRLRSASEGRIDEKSVTEWAIQVADVLDYLHNRVPSIVYRDLKPSNIMIDGNSGRVMLIDFGIARWVNIEEKGVTAVGTMGYAPPELFSGNVEPRSDIYSLGSTMFHLLTGADPQNSPLLIFDFNKNPRPRQINSGLSDQIEQVLMRSVEYDTDKRFVSAAEMRETMIKHLDNLRNGKVTYGQNDGKSASVMPSNQPVFCGFCGQKIVLSDMFCPFCGAKQPMAQQGSSPVPNSVFVAQNVSAKLIMLGTNDLDSPSYNLDKDSNLIGRRDPMSNIFPEVDLTKYDPQTKISRRHARLWREGNMFMVEDLGSSNGTSLNTAFKEQIRLLPHQPSVITNGDKIKIGDTTLHFLIG